MGGESTGCTATTTDVVLEIALFDPRRTAANGLPRDRERRPHPLRAGVDPAMVLPGMEYATRLILELCGGEASTPIIAGTLPEPPRPFTFRLEQLKRQPGSPWSRA